ncbi:MAG: hypothetical protein H0X24_24680 [Ktedonobacterales bacterium]|nr:hypothetical protein [Ktedonobacterales bacterium]
MLRKNLSRVPPERWLLLTALGVMALIASVIITGCGASSAANTLPTAQPTHPGGPATTAEPPQTYAYLYSRIDYPLQIQVNGSDSVTLNLSLNRNILTVTPTPTNGTPVASATLPVIPLPTDLQNYQDVAVQAAVQQDAGPIVWQLTSAARESLVSQTAHRYLDALAPFTWNIQAVAAGRNTSTLILTVIYTYLGGSEHPGAVPLTAAPIPIVAIAPTITNTTLPALKLPFISLTSLAGVIALLRFLQGIWQAGQNVGEAVGTAKNAVALAQKLTHRETLTPTKKRTDQRLPPA